MMFGYFTSVEYRRIIEETKAWSGTSPSLKREISTARRLVSSTIIDHEEDREKSEMGKAAVCFSE
jgi:hypothetical protein